MPAHCGQWGAHDARRTAITALIALASLASLGACTPAPCEVRAFWRNAGAGPCTTCQMSACSAEQTALNSSAVLGPCAPEYACASRCADASGGTCGCTEQCLTTPACRTAWGALAACAVRACEAPCR